MKPLNQNEIQLLAQELQWLCGARLQVVHLKGERFVFEFHQIGQKAYLLLDLRPICPILLLLKEAPWPLKQSEVKPVVLFLRSHFVGKKIKSIEAPAGWGRVMVIEFANGEKLEMRLFPRGVNLIISDGEKRVAWRPVQELSIQGEAVSVPSARTPEQMLEQYFSSSEKGKSKADPEALRQQKISKLQKALDKIQQDVELKKTSLWLKAGEELKARQTVEVAPELAPYVDPRKSLAWNIENCFKQHRVQAQKLEGLTERANVLKAELRALVEGEVPTQGVTKKQNPVQIQNWDGRHQTLASGHQLWVGRKAQENLKVLRMAKPWDYWLHLRDYPGAHAILRRNKSETINDNVLQLAAAQLLKENFRAKPDKYKGDDFDVVVAEVRFVKPIKGDRLGRVHYTNERVIRVAFR